MAAMHQPPATKILKFPKNISGHVSVHVRTVCQTEEPMETPYCEIFFHFSNLAMCLWSLCRAVIQEHTALV